ncbi:MAG TPA: hypothetical protein VKA44_04775 [Gemmatimonadota bacterium]|nr:hypothetical protein [Gemmatimonadota bacterium]
MDRWCGGRGLGRGQVVPAGRCFELGRRWYRGRLERDWERPSKEAMEAMFESAGLTGPFWEL